MERRLALFFFALSMVVLALMLGAIWQAGSPTWKTYQQEFHRLEAVGEPNAAAQSVVVNAVLVIRQELLPGCSAWTAAPPVTLAWKTRP